MDPIFYSLLVGVLVGGVFPAIISYNTLKSQERTQKQTLVFTAAVEHFKQACEMARKEGGSVMPIEDFLIHMAKLSELIIDKQIDIESLEKLMNNFHEFEKKVREIRFKFESNNN